MKNENYSNEYLGHPSVAVAVADDIFHDIVGAKTKELDETKAESQRTKEQLRDLMVKLDNQ